MRDLHVQPVLDLACLQSDVRARSVHHVRDPVRGERQLLEGLECEPHVLERRNVQAAQHDELVRAIERGEDGAVEERRGVDDDRVVRRSRDVDERRHLALHHELRILGPHGSGENVEPARVPGDVTRELLRVELARSDDEVVHGLRRLEAEHDGGVAELEVEVEEQRALPLLLREHRGKARRDDRLAGAPLGREHRHDAAAMRRGLQLPASVRRLANGEDDVVGQLR